MNSVLMPKNASQACRESHPVVGVIGGMGPDATVELMRRVIRVTPATDDVDHIHLIVDNNPKVPSRIAALVKGDGENPAPVLARMAARLEMAGADVLAIPCNTAHAYLDNIRSVVTIPVMDMIGSTVERIATMSLKSRSVGIIASTAVLNTGLYETAFKSYSLELIYPKDQADVMSLIAKAKGAAVDVKNLVRYQEIIKSLTNSGVDLILVACTDLSVITNSSLEINVPVIDALDVLVDEIINFSKGAVRASQQHDVGDNP